MESRFGSVGAGAIALAMLVAGCATTPTGEDRALARTQADHELLAQQFDRESVRAREQAEQHRTLLASYERGTQYRWVDRAGFPGGMRAMPRHCEQLIRNAEADARTYAEMAEQHRSWAKPPRGADDVEQER